MNLPRCFLRRFPLAYRGLVLFPILIPLHSFFPSPEPIPLDIIGLAILLPVASFHTDAHGLPVDDLYPNGYLLFLFHGFTFMECPTRIARGPVYPIDGAAFTGGGLS